ncbi:MAG: hypothetical protein ACJAZC_001708 [Cryomorphaceae bacterium]|jgi:hypothetical protein
MQMPKLASKYFQLVPLSAVTNRDHAKPFFSKPKGAYPSVRFKANYQM